MNPADAGAPAPELSTLFCRALYDYASPDANSLSFNQGDVIEVLTQLGSGWWDGIVRGERGSVVCCTRLEGNALIQSIAGSHPISQSQFQNKTL